MADGFRSTLHQLVALHEFEGKRFNRYHELGEYALGKRLGDFAVITPQLIVSAHRCSLPHTITRPWWTTLQRRGSCTGSSGGLGCQVWLSMTACRGMNLSSHLMLEGSLLVDDNHQQIAITTVACGASSEREAGIYIVSSTGHGWAGDHLLCDRGRSFVPLLGIHLQQGAHRRMQRGFRPIRLDCKSLSQFADMYSSVFESVGGM